MVMGLTYLAMETSILATSEVANRMAMGSTCGLMVLRTQVNFSMVSNMVRECGSSKKEAQVAHTTVTTGTM